MRTQIMLFYDLLITQLY